MPLPEGGPRYPWPPKKWLPVYSLYAEHDVWYSGDPDRLADFYSNQITWNMKVPWWKFWARRKQTETASRPRSQLHVPLAGDLAGMSAALVFGESPSITIEDKATQARLQEIMDEGDFFAALVEAAEVCAALGGVFLKPAWDKEIAEYPYLCVEHPDNVIPKFYNRFLQEATVWDVLESPGDNKIVWRHLEHHEPGVIYHGLYKGTSDFLGPQVDLKEHPYTEDIEPVVELPLPILGIQYVPNSRPNRRFRTGIGRPLGRSDYLGSEGLMDALDDTYTSWMRDVRVARGRIMVPREWLQSADGTFKFDVDQEVFARLDIQPGTKDGSGITASQFAIRAEEHEKTAMSLVSRIISNAGYSPQTFGLNMQTYSADSGAALRIRERTTLITQQRKLKFWASQLRSAVWMLLAIDKSVFGSKITPDRPAIEMADSIQPDPLENANSIEVLSRAQALSIDTKVRLVHPDWDDDAVAAEVGRIQQEAGLSVPDPATIGG